MMRGLGALLLSFMLMHAGPAKAAAPAWLDIHVGEHTNFGRVVVTIPLGVTLPAEPQTRHGNDLVVALPGAGAVLLAHGVTVRNVLGIQGGHDQLSLGLQPGSTVRVWRLSMRLVIDVFDPPPPAARDAHLDRTAPAGPRVVPRPPLAAVPGPPAPQNMAAAPHIPNRIAAQQPGPPAVAKRVEAPPLEVAGTPEDAAAAPGPLEGAEALRAVRLPGPTDTILLPFDPKVGAAAFGSAGRGHAIFDESKAIDLAALKDDAVFGGARITVSPGSTHFTMSLAAGMRLGLHRQPDGWAVTVQRQEPEREPAPVRLRGGKVVIAMKQAAEMAVVVDDVTGGKLLIGTVHDHGAAVVVPHVSPEFTLLPSWEGVAVAVVGDRLSLDVTKEGFALGTASGPPLVTLMADSAQAALESVGSLTRRFDIPPLDLATLRQRLCADIAGAARAAKQSRFRFRLRAAQDMLGLGMDREAEALLTVARSDDPAQDARPDAAALQALAAWLAAQEDAPPPPVSGLDNPALGASDEVALWRALMAPRDSAATARAAVVAADWRLLQAYPAPLRDRLLPHAAGILIAGGQLRAAEALIAAAPDGPLHTARARLLAAQGRSADALALLDRLAAGADRKESAAAVRDAVDLRVRNNSVKPAAAAQILTNSLDRWREPSFELERRLRIASLLTQAGDYRSALTGLRKADELFPQAHATVRAAEDRCIRTLVQGGAGAALAPLDLLALVADNADLLGQGDIATSLTPVLVDKLAALDLPERADRLVVKLIESTADAAPKAALGARLAGLRLDQNDAAGALAALDQTMAGGLPPDLDAGRAVMRARALAQLGEDGPALSLLATQGGTQAWELAAQLREKSHDWHGADVALQKLVQAGVPAAGALTAAQQDLVLRLASAASQAGDSATLQALSGGAGRRLSTGPRTDLFAALTVQPVREVADLPRAARDVAAAQALPAAWAGYTAH